MAGWKEKHKIMRRYDATAEMYDERYSEEQGRKYRKALECVNIAGLAVLDVGCGSGLFFGNASAKAEMVVGADVSHGLLQKANQQAKQSANVFVVQADADHLPFCDGFFGAVFAFTVLQNMPNPEATLAELKHAVKVDGKLVVTGLKKAFPLEKFIDLVEDSGFQLAAFVDEEAINCYVAVLAPLSICTSATSPVSA